MKTCTKCNESKPSDAFYRKRKGSDALRPLCKSCHVAGCRERKLSNKYGINQSTYEEMRGAQRGRCDICGTTSPDGRGDFHVDHCHKSGNVRALLCMSCNRMLGFAKDSPHILRKAADYLEHHNQ